MNKTVIWSKRLESRIEDHRELNETDRENECVRGHVRVEKEGTERVEVREP